jgi:hypothetical protein
MLRRDALRFPALHHFALALSVAKPAPPSASLKPWLRGTLLRKGPARVEAGSDKEHHWFDGPAMLLKFAFAAGRVTYANRYLRSQSKEILPEGRGRPRPDKKPAEGIGGQSPPYSIYYFLFTG